MAKVQLITGFRLSEINTNLEFTIRKHTLEHENYMLQELKVVNKSPLVTLSQKGSENTIASM
mgnify:CR=1 FL=1